MVVLLLLLLTVVGAKSFIDQANLISSFENKQDSLFFKIDSLNKELKVQEDMVEKYELTLYWLKDDYPEAAIQFENHFYNKTE